MKPVLVVSKCLGFGRCRFDGEALCDPAVERLRGRVEFVPVCPEMEIGLGVPRDPIRIVGTRSRRILYQPATERNLTRTMRDFCSAFHARLDRIDGYVLKSRSPSCGPSGVKIYLRRNAREFSADGVGFFAAAARYYFPGIPLADDEGLADPALFERFIAGVLGRSLLDAGRRRTTG